MEVKRSPLSTYLDEEALPFPFCPGCGHGLVLEALNAALVSLQFDPRHVVMVSDIGCAGLSDKYFRTHALHGLHGRSFTYASGIKLVRPELKVIVLVGDGGCGIGGNHLMHAARRNLGMSVLVFNNLNYGMTGGQLSATTPFGGRTATSLSGHLEQPMDICATVAVNGANFVARTTAYAANLTELIAMALQTEGFALVDIWELCTAHYVPRNRFSRKALEETLHHLGFPLGVLQQRTRPEYARLYRERAAAQEGGRSASPRLLKPTFAHRLTHPLKITLAGSAGMRVGSAAAAFGRATVLAGLHATQRSDYPVTVRSGYSLAEIELRPNAISTPLMPATQWLVVISKEGWSRVPDVLDALAVQDRVYLAQGLPRRETRAASFTLELRQAGRPKAWGMAALAAVLQHSALFPMEALRQAVEGSEEDLAAIAAGERILERGE